MQFNSEQLKAIEHGDGPALVIAGPGSGKTAVLTNRIKFLIESKSIPPENILVITFSKAASYEMQNRFVNLCGENFYPVNFGTFHSIFFQIIHSVYNYNTSNIMSLWNKREFMRHAIKESGILDNAENEMIDCLISDVSFYKNSNESCEVKSSSNITNDQFIKIYKEYRSAQIAAGKIDFEDMLLIVRNLFAKNKNILREYQEKYRYILIDEYQDINLIQYEIIRMLAGREANLWVCGDDDQSIYGFRGSRPEYMLGFCNDYSQADVYNLNINYRCADIIIEKAGDIISGNTNRFEKNIIGHNDKNGKFSLIPCESPHKEYENIADIINREGNGSVAILLRTNAEASRYADMLRNSNIDCIMEEKAYNPYESPYYKIIYNYLKLADGNLNAMDVNYLLPILNKPLRYIRRDCIKGSRVSFNDILEANLNKRNMQFIIKTFEYHMKKMSLLTDLYSRINYIRKAIGIDKYIKETVSNGSKILSAMEILDWIQDSSRRFCNINEMHEYATRYSEDIVNKGAEYPEKGNRKSVDIMTYHASKGLEYDTIILPHVNEGVVPHKRAIGAEVEEERRLFYVAMTRAKKNLYILFLQGNSKNKYMISRFLYKILKK